MTLVGLNLAMFLGELAQGGSQNLDSLQALGALDPLAIQQQGEWWRVITANFLHYGYLHLGVNLFALAAIGTLMERQLGPGRFLCLYLGSGGGAMALMAVYLIGIQDYNRLVVGASAGIMGLFAGLGVHYFQMWQRYPSPWTRQRLYVFGGLIIFQFVLDFQLPDVSVMSHGFGFAMGMLLTVLLTRLI
ncbi:MAG: rhomboid family intramembrane serine protease [Synechocystis sp.]|nr:rhomboid family intramembrane serine protease [Synechocystis sp.]